MRRIFIGLCLGGMFLANSSFAGEKIEVVQAEGSVSVSDTPAVRAKKVSSNSTLPSKNILATGPNGRAVVRVGNVGYLVLEKNSKIEIDNSNERAGFFRQVTGMIYYAVHTLNGKERTLEVKTKTATMGIRGTRFLVADIPGRNEVGMRKGTLSVTSPDAEFEIHKIGQQDEFEAFKREAQSAVAAEKRQFEEYKADTLREFVEYKREFALGAERMASFDGKRVDDRPLGGATRAEMETLEEYAGEWLKEVRD